MNSGVREQIAENCPSAAAHFEDAGGPSKSGAVEQVGTQITGPTRLLGEAAVPGVEGEGHRDIIHGEGEERVARKRKRKT